MLEILSLMTKRLTVEENVTTISLGVGHPEVDR